MAAKPRALFGAGAGVLRTKRNTRSATPPVENDEEGKAAIWVGTVMAAASGGPVGAQGVHVSPTLLEWGAAAAGVRVWGSGGGKRPPRPPTFAVSSKVGR